MDLNSNLHDEILKINNDIDNIITKLKNIKKNNNKLLKIKKKNKKSVKKRGLSKKILVPDDLLKLLNLKVGTKLEKPKIQKMIYKLLYSKNLYYQKDKRVLRADSEIKKIFKLDDKVNLSTNPKDKWGFNIYNFNTHLNLLYK